MTLTQITEKGIKDGEIVNADINASAAIAKSKLASLDIGNADVNASAAIAGTKISPNFGSADVVTTGNLDLSDSTGAGNNRIRLGDSDDFSIFHDGTDNKVIAANGALLAQSNSYSIRNENGSATYATIDANGKLGIGTTTIGEKLTLGDGDLKFFHSNAANAHRTTFIEFGNSSNRITSEANYGPDSSSNYAAGFKFTTKNYNGSSFETINALNIKANGNVALGITNPAFKFESNGGADNSVCFAGRSDGGNGNNARFTLKGYAHGGGANYGGGLKIQTRDTVNVFHDRLTIDSSGKVGIGTNAPSVRCDISSSDTTAWSTSNLSTALRVVNSSAVNGTAAGIQLRSFQNNGGASIQYIHAVNDGVSSYGSDLVFSTRVAYTGAYRESCRITNAGSLKFPNGHGIDFSATSDASGISNELLDDYEEGTWTPVYHFNGSSSGVTQPSTRNGKYTKIGNRVFFNCHIAGTTGSHSGYFQIGGLPFSVANDGGTNYSAFAGWVYSGFDNEYQIIFRSNPSSTLIEVQRAGASVFSSQMGESANYMVTGHYKAA